MKTIQEMASEAGISSAVGKYIALDSELEAFAALVREDEREACALIAWNYEPDEYGPIETAIRARSNT